MKTPATHLCLFALCLLLSACGSSTPAATEGEAAEAPDRNMFGHYVPRGLTVKAENLMPGYVMFVVPNSSLVYLADRDGHIVHQWKGNYGVMGAYLMDDGSLFQNAMDVDFPVFDGGGSSGRLQQIAWDSKMLWDFEFANEQHHAHHDFAVMPNGNVLALAWEVKTYEEAIQAGRDPEKTPPAGLWPDMVVEIEPQGKYGIRVFHFGYLN